MKTVPRIRPTGVVTAKSRISRPESSQKNSYMYRLSAASTPTIRNTISTPANSQRKDPFWKALRTSWTSRRITRCSPLLVGCGRWGISRRVPKADIQMVAAITTARLRE